MEIVFRSAVVFLFLWILLRALGKRELTELTPFELVLVIVMGDAAQQGIRQEDYSGYGGDAGAGHDGLDHSDHVLFHVSVEASEGRPRGFTGAGG